MAVAPQLNRRGEAAPTSLPTTSIALHIPPRIIRLCTFANSNQVLIVGLERCMHKTTKRATQDSKKPTPSDTITIPNKMRFCCWRRGSMEHDSAGRDTVKPGQPATTASPRSTPPAPVRHPAGRKSPQMRWHRHRHHTRHKEHHGRHTTQHSCEPYRGRHLESSPQQTRWPCGADAVILNLCAQSILTHRTKTTFQTIPMTPRTITMGMSRPTPPKHGLPFDTQRGKKMVAHQLKHSTMPAFYCPLTHKRAQLGQATRGAS